MICRDRDNCDICQVNRQLRRNNREMAIVLVLCAVAIYFVF